MKDVNNTAILQANLPKVNGSARYGIDIRPKNALIGYVVRSPIPHARIVKIDVSKARNSPGVHAIVTAEDIPGLNAIDRQVIDQPILAYDKVRSVLDALALIAADTIEEAQAAARLIDLVLEPLPGVFTIDQSLAPDAPQVHDGGNLLKEYHLTHGDIEAGFSQADVIMEGSYSTPVIDHSYLEPTAGAAEPMGVDGVRIWYGCNSVYVERAVVAKVLGLPDEKVEVIHPYTGGSFGGRNEGLMPSFLALLTMKSKRPVRIAYSREEVFIATAKRHPQTIKVRTGATHEGHLTAASYQIVFDTGAYAHWGPSILLFASIGAPGPYRIPNLQVDSKIVYTNNVTMGAMRSWGMPAVTFATESQLDRIASRLGIHPLILRWLNAAEDGDKIITGGTLPKGVRLKDTIAAAAADLGITLPE